MFPPVRFQLMVINECASSQEELLAHRGQPGFHGQAVLALHQTAGYGRRGRAWNTGHGNLALSIGLELARTHEQSISLLPFLLGIALRKTVAQILEEWGTSSAQEAGRELELRLKWPNDLYLQGRKLSGMIAQARQGDQGSDVVLGIGLNLREAPLPEAIALSSLCPDPAKLPTPEAFAGIYLRELEAAFRAAADFSWIKQEWEAGARLEQLLYVVGEKEAVAPLRLLPSGELLVRDAHGQERKLASEETSVRFVPVVPAP